MKHILLALTLIFSMSGSVNADDHNTRWILIMSETTLLSPHINTRVFHSIDVVRKYMTQSDTECYEDLKKDALRRNKNSGIFQGENRFKIEIVDDVIISAKSRFMNRNGSEVRVQIELHCVQITLD